MKKNTIWIVLTVLIISGMALSAFVLASPPPAAKTASLPAEVSIAEAAQMRDEGAFILDVRTQAEWDAGHIPGATLIPLDQLPERYTELPTDQPVVIICRSGNRSAQAQAFLERQGMTNTTSVTGGMNQWTAAGYETVVD